MLPRYASIAQNNFIAWLMRMRFDHCGACFWFREMYSNAQGSLHLILVSSFVCLPSHLSLSLSLSNHTPALPLSLFSISVSQYLSICVSSNFSFRHLFLLSHFSLSHFSPSFISFSVTLISPLFCPLLSLSLQCCHLSLSFCVFLFFSYLCSNFSLLLTPSSLSLSYLLVHLLFLSILAKSFSKLAKISGNAWKQNKQKQKTS